MNSNQTLAIAALRNADESKRLQGQAFRNGRMCACAVVVTSLMPDALDVTGNSYDDDQAVYMHMRDLLGADGVNAVISLNDDLNPDGYKTPKYTFAEMADKLEEQWSA